MNFCNFISNMRHESRFVTLAPMRHGCEERRVGLDEQSLQRQLADDLALLFRVFVCDRSGYPDVEIDSNGFLRGFEVPVVGV